MGIRSTMFVALAFAGLWEGCRPAPDPVQLSEVDGLITNMEAAMLTLNELDADRFDRVDSLYADRGRTYVQRFTDTLNRTGATMLAEHFLMLRDAGRMGADHRRTQLEVRDAVERLRTLREDLRTGAMTAKEGGVILERERGITQQLEQNVHHTIANYRAVQQAWDEVPNADSILALEHGPANTLQP